VTSGGLVVSISLIEMLFVERILIALMTGEFASGQSNSSEGLIVIEEW
jgi:hypothetical protein